MSDFKMVDLNIHDCYHSLQNPQQTDHKRKRKANGTLLTEETDQPKGQTQQGLSFGRRSKRISKLGVNGNNRIPTVQQASDSKNSCDRWLREEKALS